MVFNGEQVKEFSLPEGKVVKEVLINGQKVGSKSLPITLSPTSYSTDLGELQYAEQRTVTFQITAGGGDGTYTGEMSGDFESSTSTITPSGKTTTVSLVYTSMESDDSPHSRCATITCRSGSETATFNSTVSYIGLLD